MTPKLIIFDFDGTVTDAEAEGKPYRQGYFEDIALLAETPLQTVLAWAEEFDGVVAQNQGSYGWDFGGHIVAPACVDPYLRVMPTARMILDRAGCFMNATERDLVLDRILYKYNYQKTATAFRDGALALLKWCQPIPTCVVTNSGTAAVQEKLRHLGEQDGGEGLAWLVDRVYGSAKKYMISQDFDRVDEKLNVDGLDRPILLRRRHYFDVLDGLRQDFGVTWQDMVVFGDIFELDLCLPLSLGARVGLVLSKFTPDYERQFLQAHPRGFCFDDLPQIGTWLAGLSDTG
jgi:hypothetical protein